MDEKKFYIAAIGMLPEDTKAVKQLLDTVEGSFAEAVGANARMAWLLSPSYSDAAWLKLAKERSVPCHIVRRESDAAWAEAGDTQVVARSALRSFEGDWLSDHADVLLVVWDEQMNEMDGAVWEMLYKAHTERIPCVWLSKETGKVYWPMENYYERFEKEGLISLFRRMYAAGPVHKKVDGKGGKWLLALGARLQDRFLKKHTPQGVEQKPPRDVLIEGELPESANNVQRQLVALFKRYDRDAIDYGEKYRAVMYWRAVLPTIAAVFLAIGFYTADLPGMVRTVAGWIHPGGALATWNTPAPLDNLVHLLSGWGFLLNGFILLYAYRMAEAKRLKYWHERYVNSRQTAEVYRVLAHFAPYGISVDLKSVCAENPVVLTTVRDEMRRVGMSSAHIDERLSAEILDHVEEMLEDQSNYHEKSVQRYAAITAGLMKRYKLLKDVAFIWLLIRALTQCLIGMGIIGQGDKTGTMANMFAMLLPAAATYFASKNDQCKYEFHLENHRMMKKSIDDARARIREIRESTGTPSVEMIASVARTLSELMILDDTSNWHAKVSKASFTQL